ncbi:hypothetical protein O1611_g6208 [Lasiodiplodia mahajangana]|uniref:Uncharacterized protein n=1 Tax=Lasiodiplodia mahajangana TaxID=1108764 RepID=A0ACC2JIU2_9PEZI|nr:hypothetical protein O1611_g6208 [Lasiodiplodia mahajangana]
MLNAGSQGGWGVGATNPLPNPFDSATRPPGNPFTKPARNPFLRSDKIYTQAPNNNPFSASSVRNNHFSAAKTPSSKRSASPSFQQKNNGAPAIRNPFGTARKETAPPKLRRPSPVPSFNSLGSISDYVEPIWSDVPTTLNSMEEGFCRALCLGQVPLHRKPDEWVAICYRVFATQLQNRLPMLPLDDALRKYVDTRQDAGFDYREFLQHHFGSRMMGRCFFLTERNHPGMGTGAMLPNDIIVVPLGCRTPIIIRPEDNEGKRFRFVGDAYLDGYMDGKAIARWKASGKKIERYPSKHLPSSAAIKDFRCLPSEPVSGHQATQIEQTVYIFGVGMAPKFRILWLQAGKLTLLSYS